MEKKMAARERDRERRKEKYEQIQDETKWAYQRQVICSDNKRMHSGHVDEQA